MDLYKEQLRASLPHDELLSGLVPEGSSAKQQRCYGGGKQEILRNSYGKSYDKNETGLCLVQVTC